MKKRSGFVIMARLVGLVRPLAGYMVLAVAMGLVGHLAAAFITVFGGFAAADLLGIPTPFTLSFIFVSVIESAISLSRFPKPSLMVSNSFCERFFNLEESSFISDMELYRFAAAAHTPDTENIPLFFDSSESIVFTAFSRLIS